MEYVLKLAYLFSQQNAWNIWCYENSSWQLQDVYVFVSHDVCINFVINAYCAVLRQFNFFSGESYKVYQFQQVAKLNILKEIVAI